MAKRDVVIRISAEDMASGVVSRIRSNFVEMASSVASGEAIYNGVTGAASRFYGLISSSIRDALDAEKGNAQLARALSAVGHSSRESFNEMSDFASSLSAVTAQDDDAIKSVMQLLATIGKLSGGPLKDATRATLDLAAATGKDLNDAAMAVAKAATGNATALQKLGITIGDNVKPGEEFATVLAKINEQMGGAAQTEADTYAGKIRNAANAWGDFKKALGEFVIQELNAGGELDAIARGLRSYTEGISKNASIEKQLALLEKYSRIELITGEGGTTSGDLTPLAQQWANSLPIIREYADQIRGLAQVTNVTEEQLAGFFRNAINPNDAEQSLAALRGVYIWMSDKAKQIATQDAETQKRIAKEKNDAILAAESEAAQKRLAAQEKAAREAEQAYQDSVKRQLAMVEAAFAPAMSDLEDQVDLALAMAGTDADRGLVGKLLFGNMRPEDLQKALTNVVSSLDKRFQSSGQSAGIEPPMGGGPFPPQPLFTEDAATSLEKMIRQLKSATGETKKMAQNWTDVKSIADEIGTATMKSLSDGIYGLLSGTMSLGESLRSIFDGIVQAIERAIAEYIAAQIVIGIVSLFNTGGQVFARAQRAASGWTVPGPNRNVDMVPAMLSPGERVLSRPEAERYANGLGSGGVNVSIGLTVLGPQQIARTLLNDINDLVQNRRFRLVASEVRA